MEPASAGTTQWPDSHTPTGVRTRGSNSRYSVQDQDHGDPARPT